MSRTRQASLTSAQHGIPYILKSRKSVAPAKIRDTSGIFQTVGSSMRGRYQACLTTSGRNLEHLL